MEFINEGVIQSAHDCSEGGLYVTLVESAMTNDLGFDITSDSMVRKDAFLFGEAQSRVVVSVREEDQGRFLEILEKHSTVGTLLGHTTKGELRVDDESFGFIAEAKEKYLNSLGNLLN